MSRFFSDKFAELIPYTPGEQPQRRERFIKLNTNESPFPPSPKALEMASQAAEHLQLYSDPECKEIRAVLAERLGVEPDEIVMTNGSDEILYLAFLAFCDSKTPAAFPDITYGFYPVFADMIGIPYTKIPLKEDFTLDPADYNKLGKTIFIANPNAPTGIALTRKQIEGILIANPDNVVVIDEAYVDFGGESCVPLIHEYDNLLVTQTFSKSRSMAGARLGFGVGCKALTADLNTLRYSMNPYNVNSVTLAAGIGALIDDDYRKENCRVIMENRAWTAAELGKLGFVMTDSSANFLFARHPELDGGWLYAELKARGILIRHFTAPRIAQYNRITIGTREQMQALIDMIARILEEKK